MDFRSLTYFSMVAKERNFTRAAQKLNMSQPPLSNQIRHLEEELGAQLFIRGSRSLQLTDAGTLLLRRTEQMLDLASRTRGEIASLSAGPTGTLFLGMVEGRAPFLAARWIASFRESHPMVRYEMRSGSRGEILDQLNRGLIDLAVIDGAYDKDRLSGVSVGIEPWVALISKEHPLAQEPGDTVTLSRIAEEHLIIPRRKSQAKTVHQWFDSIGKEPTIICEQSGYVDAMALVEQNVGIGIFPRTTTADPNEHVVVKIITEPEKMVEYSLVWNRNQNPAGLPGDFAQYVQSEMKAMTK